MSVFSPTQKPINSTMSTSSPIYSSMDHQYNRISLSLLNNKNTPTQKPRNSTISASSPKDTTMANASLNIPTMAEPSDNTAKKKQKMSTAFSLELRPATVLRQAFAALSDPQFNSGLFGFLEVGGKGFKITVHRTVETVSGSEQSVYGFLEVGGKGFKITVHRTVEIVSGSELSVYGFLHLIPESLMSFTCTYPLKKLVRFDIVSDVLSKARDDDIVHVYAEYESSNLFFEFSRNPDEHVTPDTIIMPGILMFEMTPQCRSLPDISYGLHTLLPHSYISQLTSDMLREPSTTRSPDVNASIRTQSVQTTAINGVDKASCKALTACYDIEKDNLVAGLEVFQRKKPFFEAANIVNKHDAFLAVLPEECSNQLSFLLDKLSLENSSRRTICLLWNKESDDYILHSIKDQLTTAKPVPEVDLFTILGVDNNGWATIIVNRKYRSRVYYFDLVHGTILPLPKIPLSGRMYTFTVHSHPPTSPDNVTMVISTSLESQLVIFKHWGQNKFWTAKTIEMDQHYIFSIAPLVTNGRSIYWIDANNTEIFLLDCWGEGDREVKCSHNTVNNCLSTSRTCLVSIYDKPYVVGLTVVIITVHEIVRVGDKLDLLAVRSLGNITVFASMNGNTGFGETPFTANEGNCIYLASWQRADIVKFVSAEQGSLWIPYVVLRWCYDVDVDTGGGDSDLDTDSSESRFEHQLEEEEEDDEEEDEEEEEEEEEDEEEEDEEEDEDEEEEEDEEEDEDEEEEEAGNQGGAHPVCLCFSSWFVTESL